MSGVPISVIRGGSSKGLFFLQSDLPNDVQERNAVLLGIMGSPDPRQIDGLGGAHPLTSKVAIVSPSERPDIDVEYLFLQLGIENDLVSDRQNCGNLLAGVGPFAVESGLVPAPAAAEAMTIRILMRNTNSVATARFTITNGTPVYEGATAISGVPGTASPIFLEFDDLAGGSCGALLPTGNIIDDIDNIACTLIDNGMPVVVMRASDFGLTGSESPAELEANLELRKRLESIRLQAGELMHLGDVTDTTVPKLTLVSPPTSDGNLTTRTFIPHRCHEAIGVLGAVSVATAALLPGSTADQVSLDPIGDEIRLEHPTGHFDAVVETQTTTGRLPEVKRAGIVRTARKLMDGTAYPRLR